MASFTLVVVKVQGSEACLCSNLEEVLYKYV